MIWHRETGQPGSFSDMRSFRRVQGYKGILYSRFFKITHVFSLLNKREKKKRGLILLECEFSSKGLGGEGVEAGTCKHDISIQASEKPCEDFSKSVKGYKKRQRVQ